MKKKKFKWSGRQVTALRGSIKKWEKVCTGQYQEQNGNDCKCCEYYNTAYHYYKDISCSRCPVKLYTGQKMCKETPYQEFSFEETSISRHEGSSHVDGYADTPELKRLAQAELDFLKEVLEAGL